MKNFKVGIDENIDPETKKDIVNKLEKENIAVVDVPVKGPSKLMTVLTIAEAFESSSSGQALLRPYADELFRLRNFTPKTKKVPEKTEKDFEALRKAKEKRERKKHKRTSV